MTNSSRRRFLYFLGSAALGAVAAPGTGSLTEAGAVGQPVHSKDTELVKLFLCGDVMTGRGIDQSLPHPGDPTLYERYMASATGYLDLAETANGPIPTPVGFDYIWGDALGALHRARPDARIVNLETSVTSSDSWERKGINYRMSPANIACLTAARIDCCTLANNHVLDWGRAGLEETLATLKQAGIATAGAGHNEGEAQAPAILETQGRRRVLVCGFGTEASGIPVHWGARKDRPGVNLLDDFSRRGVERIAEQVMSVKQSGDVAVASIHWGPNWGYGIPGEERRFAQALIEQAGVDVVHGHSSHHVKGIEVYRDKLILYGCGDFLNDYEGIGGRESYRSDLGVMYLPILDAATGRLTRLEMIPFQMRNFRLTRASKQDSQWLADTLSRESEQFGPTVLIGEDRSLILEWS